MTTTVASNSAERCIRLAMKDAGLLEDGQNPTPEQFDDMLGRLNDLANLWQTQGLKLWLLEDVSIPLVAGQQRYVFSPTGDVVMTKPLRVLQAYYRNSDGIRRPLVPLSWDEWLRLAQVSIQGAINSYFVDKQQNQLNVSFWNVPDATAATGTCHVLLQHQITNLVKITDAMSFPLEWFLALRWGLADEIATGQPVAIMQRCEQRANTYRMALEDWDVEDAATKFEPDPRSQYYQNSFR